LIAAAGRVPMIAVFRAKVQWDFTFGRKTAIFNE